MDTIKIVVWGDSIGAEQPAPQWPEMCQGSMNCGANFGRDVEFTNLCVCGRPAVVGKAMFAEQVAPVKPAVVIIQFGFNDLRFEKAGMGKRSLGPLPEYEAAMTEMITNSMKIGAKVLVLGNHDPFCSFMKLPSGQTYPEAVATYRKAAERVAQKCGADYIDMAEAVRNSELAPVDVTADGVHLSPWGKRVYAYTVANYLIELISTGRI